VGEVRFGAGFWGPFPLGWYVEYAVILARYRWDEHIAQGAAHAPPVPDEIARSFVFAGTAGEVTQTVRRLEAWSREVMPAWRISSLAGR